MPRPATSTRPQLPAARRSRSVIVVGGGPAGLEAARVLAEQGHRVTIWESGTELGGVLRDVRGADPVLDRYCTWLRAEVGYAGVERGARPDRRRREPAVPRHPMPW